MSERTKRIIMCVIGVFLSGVAAGAFRYTNFGMDPFQVFAHGMWGRTTLGYGIFYTILNLVLLIFMVWQNRKMIGLGTIINIFLLGYVVDFTADSLEVFQPEPSMLFRIIVLIIALILSSAAASLYFVADLGVSAYDWIALTISARKGWQFRIVRICCDLVCVIIGGVLGATVGIGTVLSALCMGPVIQWFNVKMSEPLRYGRSISAK